MRWRILTACLLLFSGPYILAKDPAKPDFPTAEEVSHVVEQASRAIDLYENANGSSETSMGGRQENDRRLIRETRILLSSMKSNTNAFNSLSGIAVLVSLDDAARNMSIDSTQLAAKGGSDALNGNMAKANASLSLAQTFQSTGEVLYQASDSLSRQLVKYVVADMALRDQLIQTANKCAQVLRKLLPKTPTPPQIK